MVREAFGRTIRKFREEAGLTQDGLAEAVECSRQTVGRWERGASIPGEAMISELLTALGRSPVVFRRALDQALEKIIEESQGKQPPPSRRGKRASADRAYPIPVTFPSEISGAGADDWIRGYILISRRELLR
jgi:transcriptional regulator with XRE-family HTH domain